MRSKESAKLNRSKKVVCFIYCLSLLSEGVLNAIFSVNWDYNIKHVNNTSCLSTGYTVVLFIAYLVHHHILLDILFIIIFHIFHLFTWQLLSYQLPHLSSPFPPDPPPLTALVLPPPPPIEMIPWAFRSLLFAFGPRKVLLCCLLLLLFCFLFKLYSKLLFKWQMVFCASFRSPIVWAWQLRRHRHVP